ncbi:hypothetical protein [Microbacterium sp. p3-SID336]|uniref:hypothetical protein n=1 Tax=Microbacterium sp. p3-SID336 TaxID=2916212 RepID=UPI0021A88B2B|nr:hypothetical protein [Microbacterium sp. p3-SID336]MCT1479478.1 hypothetical protein [Microbacterium sp. p3-SID336]
MPTPSMTVAPEAVTPGFAGFAVIVIVLVAVILLIWDMNRRIRRVRYREEVREELDAEQAAQVDSDARGSQTSGTTEPDADADGRPRER